MIVITTIYNIIIGFNTCFCPAFASSLARTSSKRSGPYLNHRATTSVDSAERQRDKDREGERERESQRQKCGGRERQRESNTGGERDRDTKNGKGGRDRRRKRDKQSETEWGCLRSGHSDGLLEPLVH